MSNNGNNIDIEKLVFEKANKEEKEKLRVFLNSEKEQEDFEKLFKPKKAIVITDFMDKKVVPFASNCIYTILNKKEKTKSLYKGTELVGLFGNDDVMKKEFEDKLMGETIELIGGFKAIFKQYETEE